MHELVRTEAFIEWLDTIGSQHSQRIAQRLLRVETGNLGDYKPLKEGVFELRFKFGAGYRIYCIQQGKKIIVLLGGGDKSTQKWDIPKALELAKNL